MFETRRKTRIAGLLLIAFGSLGAVLFSVDAMSETPAAPGIVQAVAAAILAFAGVRTYQGRNYRGTMAAAGIFLLALVLGVAADAIIRDGFTQPLIDAVFVTLFALPVILALLLIRTGSAQSVS
jgi:hypothetical protein